MDRKSNEVTTKRVLRPATMLAVSLGALGAFLLVALVGQARASSFSPDCSDIPLPPPTVPATIGPASPTPHGTSTATATRTPPGPQPTGHPTVPPCELPFTDVHPTDWFYVPVQWMYCNGVVSGYPDNTFRPNLPTTRGQIMKIVVGAFGLPIHTDGGPHFADVSAEHAFYSFVETAYFYSVVGGYPCGGPDEPCDAENRPYFRPNAQVTRAQLTKITVLSAIQVNPGAWQLLNPPEASFVDVAHGSTFYRYVETAVAHDLLQGYTCGSPGEPCPGRYFRPGNNATRAQLSKIVYQAVTQP
jgi:hypothetical protein